MRRVDILRTRKPVTFVYVEGDKRLEVPRHARSLTLVYRTLQDLGMTDRVERIADAFWALRERGYIDTIEISYRAGDPNGASMDPPYPPSDRGRSAG